MVEMALSKLNENDIVHLDEERKAAMVSNLLVVLCGSKDVQPIVNSGQYIDTYIGHNKRRREVEEKWKIKKNQKNKFCYDYHRPFGKTWQLGLRKNFAL